MDSLSKEKLTYYKEKKRFTNKRISELTGLPISSIDKLFSGLNKNPTLDTLKKIANILDCSIDDFINYEREPLVGHYTDRQTVKIAQELHRNEELKSLFETIKDFSKKDLKLMCSIANRLSTTNPE